MTTSVFSFLLVLPVYVTSEPLYGHLTRENIEHNLAKRSAALLPGLSVLKPKLPPEVGPKTNSDEAPKPRTKLLQPLLPYKLPSDSSVIPLQLPQEQPKKKQTKPHVEASSFQPLDLPKDTSVKRPPKVISITPQDPPEKPEKEMSLPPKKILPVNPPKPPVNVMSLPPKSLPPKIKLPMLPKKELSIAPQKPSAINPPKPPPSLETSKKQTESPDPPVE
ncbi:uncharacterized protein LOC128191849 [Crassostrea angulata]|uniref:uncharacterized protein LOC128191849 n=1 Tax=Magallana angulata TaxID=2784310 RepID=UPI0022B1288D|nr:uncharacterized protein LOC128191849 [Crassostrea angulata]XP_052720138.1 uncharacterized protein LOC128191849 [Crassostrea angulata]